MNGCTSSLFSFLKMQTKTDFIVEPYKLLETNAISILDIQPYIEKIEDIAKEVFVRPDRGAYKKNDSVPYILANEELFTHEDTHEFFPEISQRIFTFKTKKHPTVGKKITWQQAFEERINVYNKAGRLLLNKNSDRDNFLFSPGPEIYATKFIIEFIRYTILDSTAWGNPEVVFENIKEILSDENDLEELMKLGDFYLNGLTKIVKDSIKKAPWLIYSVYNFRNQLIIESSCDWRHYNCNLVLWEQQQKEVGYEDPMFAYSYKYKDLKLELKELEELFKLIEEKASIKIENLDDLFQLLDHTKNDSRLTNILLDTFKEIKISNNASFITTSVMDGIIRRNNGLHNSIFNESIGVYILEHSHR